MAGPGVLKKDAIKLNDEIKRASGVFNDLKKRGKALEKAAEDAKASLNEVVQEQGQGKADMRAVGENVRMHLVYLRTLLQREIIEDKIFVSEIDRIRQLIDIARRQFGTRAHNLESIEGTVALAEGYVQARLQQCNSFIQKVLNPRTLRTAFGPINISEVKQTYELTREITAQLNETSRQTMIKVLSAYAQLYKILPRLERAETERTRMFE